MAQEFELKLKKLKDKEEEELAILKEKRIKHEEMIKTEHERKEAEKFLATLRKNKETLTADLEQSKKKSFALQIENDSWDDVRKKTLKDLKENEKILNDQLEEIWKGRELFCDESDKYIEEYGISSKWWKEKMNIVNDPQLLKRRHLKKNQDKAEKETNERIISNLNTEIKELKDKIEEEKLKKENNDFLMKKLEKEKEYLLQETNTGEFKRIKENLELLNKRCAELVKQIGQRENSSKLPELNFEVEDRYLSNFDLDANNKKKEVNCNTEQICLAERETQNRPFGAYDLETSTERKQLDSHGTSIPQNLKDLEANKEKNDKQEKKSLGPSDFEAQNWLFKTPSLEINNKRKEKLIGQKEKIIPFVEPNMVTENLLTKKNEKTSEDSLKRKKLDENTSAAEESEPDSFLFQMLDPATVKAAKAKAKSRRLSSMHVQERNRHLQLSFNNFLSQIQD